ncbi:hypothetical protein K438DRAFT_1471196, partial [Mycena galopus ATCC 62051]
TGMWIAEPEMTGKYQLVTIVHLHAFLCGAQFPSTVRHIPVNFRYYHFLDAFEAFHFNMHIDYHAND